MRIQIFVLSLGLTWVSSQVAKAQSPSTEDVDSTKAAVRFQQGVELYREGSYEGALAEFRKAYQLSPSYRVLYNIAQTQNALHDFVGASKSLAQYIAEGGFNIPAERRAQVEELSAMLKERIAHLEISTNVSGADIRVDDVSVGTSPLPRPVPVNVGTHKVSAFKAGSPETVRILTVAGREIVRVECHVIVTPAQAKLTPVSPPVPLLVKAPAPTPPSRAKLVISISTTAALAVGTGVMGYLALDAQKNLKNQVGIYPNTAANIDAARSKSQNYGYVTDALGAATLISGGLALYFALTHSSSPPAKTTEAVVLPTISGVGLRGNF